MLTTHNFMAVLMPGKTLCIYKIDIFNQTKQPSGFVWH